MGLQVIGNITAEEESIILRGVEKWPFRYKIAEYTGYARSYGLQCFRVVFSPHCYSDDEGETTKTGPWALWSERSNKYLMIHSQLVIQTMIDGFKSLGWTFLVSADLTARHRS